MSETPAKYITAGPQLNRAATAEAQAVRLEMNLQEIQNAAQAVCAAYRQEKPTVSPEFANAIRTLAGLISFSGWSQL